MAKRAKIKQGRISLLTDDLIGLILSKVARKRDRKSFSEVCKQWYKVEGLSRTSLYLTSQRPNFSARALSARYPNVVSLKLFKVRSETELESIAQTCPRLDSIVLVSRDVYLGRKSLGALGIGCPKLSTVLLFGNAIGHAGVAWLVKSAMHLRSLKLVDSLVKDHTLKVIVSAPSSSISTLMLMKCCNVTDQGLALLANGESTSRTIKKLVVRVCNRITDTGVEHLQNMCSLEHLEFEHWEGKFSDIGGVAISKIQTLKTLNLRWLQGVSNTTVEALAKNCHKLEVLDLHGCKRVTGSGIRAFSFHKCLKKLLLFGVRTLDLSDVETVVLGCRSLESISVDSYLETDPNWSSQLMHVKTRRIVKFISA